MRYSVKRTLNVDRTPSVCMICGKICKGARSLKSHITQMHTEKQKSDVMRGRPIGVPAWNKGLTNETDCRVDKISKSLSQTLRKQVDDGSYVPRRMGAEAAERLSKSQSENNRGGRCKWFSVNGIKVQGTWEYNVALKLNELHINWSRGKPIKYLINGKYKHYTADFYLPDENVFLEIKGYWWGNDKDKMQCVCDQYPNMNICIVEKDDYEKFLEGELVWRHQRLVEA